MNPHPNKPYTPRRQLLLPVALLLILFAISSRFVGQASSAPVVTANKTDALQTDADSSGGLTPGDTIRYTTVINNSGTDPATGVSFSDTIDSGTTLSGSAHVSPIAFDDSYSSLGNVGITVPAANGVLANDVDPDSFSSLSVVPAAGASAHGAFSINANGGFSYASLRGYEGPDSFTYTLTDNDPLTPNATGTVNITVNEVIWFIDNSQPTQGTGVMSNPFNSLDGANGYNANAPDETGDIIFIYSGSGTYGGGIALLNNQILIGQGASASIAAIAGITVPPFSNTLPSTGGSRPTVGNTSGNVVTLSNGTNTVRGLNINQTNGIGLFGSSFSIQTISEMNIAGSTKAVDISDGSILNLTLGQVQVTGSSNGGVRLQSTGGSSSLSNVNITTTGGTGFLARNSGNLTIAGNSNTIASTNGTGVDIRDLTIAANIIFQSVGATNGTVGINLDNTGSSGSFTVNGGTLSGHSSDGIKLNNVPGGASFNNMTVDQSGKSDADGVDATSVTGLSFNGTTITAGSGNAYALLGSTIRNLTATNTVFDGGNGSAVANIDGVKITNLLGTNTLTGVTVRDGKDINMLVDNSTNGGSLDTLTISGSTFTKNIAGDNLQIRTSGTANLKVVVQNNGGTNSAFSGAVTDSIDFQANGGTLQGIVTGSTFTGNLGNVVNMSAANSGHLIARVHNLSNLTSSGSNVINTIAFDNSTIEATVENNTITSHPQGAGIRFILEGNGTVKAKASGNTISGATQSWGIIAQPRAGNGRLDLTLNNNIITNTGANALDGIEVTSGSSDGGDTNVVCLNMFSNTSSSTDAALDGYFLRHRTGTTFFLQDFPSGTAANWVTTTKSNTGSVFTSGTFTNATSACATPTVPTASVSTNSVVDSGLHRAPLADIAPLSITNVASTIVWDNNDNLVIASKDVHASKAVAPPPAADVEVTIGTLPAGKSVTIVFDVTVNSITEVSDLKAQVCNQGTVSGTGFSNVLTDDPDVGGSSNPTCTTFQTGTINIVKDASPNGSQTFGFASPGLSPTSFTLDDNGNNGDTYSNTQAFTAAPGQYAVSENDPSATGYTLTGLDCNDDASSVASGENTGTRTATINLEPNETVTCTFTNTVAPEPDNYPTNFAATAVSHTQITTTWTDSTGTNLPDGYLVMCSETNSFTDPVDLTAQSDDTACADGTGVQNVAHGSGGSVAWPGLDPNTTYYFKIYPYSNSGTSIDYKTDATPPTANATTLQTPGTITYQKAVTQGDPNNPNQGFTLNIRRPDGSIISGLSDVKPGTGPWGDGGLTPGLTYTVHEVSIPAGWRLDNIACDDTAASSTFGTFTSGDTSIEVTLAPGGDVVCTFTNSFDITDPVITVPSNVTVEAPADTTPSSTGTATATDDRDTSPTISFSDVVTAGNCAGNFVITRTWTATDDAGNQDSADQTITSRDTTVPNLTVPANVQINAGDSTNPSNTGTATATDAGSGPPTITFSDSQVGTVITRTWTATDGCGNFASANQTITIISDVDLEITISESTDPVVAGSNAGSGNGNDNLVHTITVKNNGPSTATNIVIQFGANTLTAPSAGSFSVGNNLPPNDPNQWGIPSLASGDSATMTLTWDVGAGYSDSNPIFSDAFVQSVDQTDTDDSNNSDNEGSSVVYDVDLTLTKEDGGVMAAPGDVLVYHLSVQNSGATAALNTIFRETVPANTSFNAASSTAGWSCSDGDPAGTVCTLNAGTVAGNGDDAAVNFAVNVLPSAYPGVIVNSASVSANNSSTAGASSRTATALIYLSSEDTASIDGLSYADEDIIVHNPADGSWAMYFDGSDVGITDDVYGFIILSDGSILMAFKNPINVPGVGSVTRNDVVQFFPASLGANTTGTFALIFDGSDVSFTADGEDIDAVGVTADGRLVLSTTGSWSVPATGGGTISGSDEDLFIFNATSLGLHTTGTFELLYDGSDVDMSSEDVNGVWIDPATGDIYLTTTGDFNAGGLTGKDEDIFRFVPSSLGSSTAGSYGPILFDGSTVGFTRRVTDFSIDDNAPLLAVSPPPQSDNADLSVTLSDDNDPVTVGDTVNYTVNVHNGGPDAAQNSTVHVVLDSQVVVQGYSSNVGSCSDSLNFSTGQTEINCSLGTLGNGANATISIETQATSTGVANHSASVGSDTADGTSGNNSVAETTTINSGGGGQTGNIIYISATGSGSVGGVRYEDEDILAYYPDSNTWAMFFDGSLQGFTRDINAFHITDNGSIYMSFDGEVTIPDAGAVTRQDIVFYDSTTGIFSLFFDGSAHDLTTSDENIDGLWVSSVLPIFAVSTTGTAKVNGSSLEVRDEDVMIFNMSTGTWTMGVNNSAVGYTGDVDALFHTGSDFYFSINDSFSAVGAERRDVFILHATALGENTAGTFGPGLFFDASAVGFSGDVDGLHVTMNP
ncbi:MAG: Ig-like domain-containing protein [Chloroflexota bacterium]